MFAFYRRARCHGGIFQSNPEGPKGWLQNKVIGRERGGGGHRVRREGGGGGWMENERARERDPHEFPHGGGAGQKETD